MLASQSIMRLTNWLSLIYIKLLTQQEVRVVHIVFLENASAMNRAFICSWHISGRNIKWVVVSPSFFYVQLLLTFLWFKVVSLATRTFECRSISRETLLVYVRNPSTWNLYMHQSWLTRKRWSRQKPATEINPLPESNWIVRCFLTFVSWVGLESCHLWIWVKKILQVQRIESDLRTLIDWMELS